MPRSRQGLLLILMVSVVTLSLLSGIILYGRFNSFSPAYGSQSKTETGVFSMKEDQIRRIRIYTNGRLSLEILKNSTESSQSLWEVQGSKDSRIDEKKIKHFVDQILGLSLNPLPNGRKQDQEKNMGFDYPVHVISIQGQDFREELIVGGRIPNGNSRYAWTQSPLSGKAWIGLLTDPFGLLDYEASNFFSSTLFELKRVNRFDIQIPYRSFHLGFQEHKKVWQLVQPFPWQAQSSEVEAMIQNLFYLVPQRSILFEDLPYYGVDLKKPHIIYELGNEEKRQRLTVYYDKKGLPFGHLDHQKWAVFLPSNMLPLFDQSPLFLLKPIPNLPSFEQLKSIRWQNLFFYKWEQHWYQGIHQLKEDEEKKLLLWYNDLSVNPLISTRNPIDLGYPWNSSYRTFRLMIQTQDGKKQEIQWMPNTEETGFLILDGERTGFEVKLPRSAPNFHLKK